MIPRWLRCVGCWMLGVHSWRYTVTPQQSYRECLGCGEVEFMREGLERWLKNNFQADNP